MNNTDDTTLPAGPLAGNVVHVEEQARPRLPPSSPGSSPTSQSLVGTLLPGPARRHRRDQRREAHAQRRPAHLPRPAQDFGGKDYALRYEGILSSAWLLTGQAAGTRRRTPSARRPRPATPSSSATSTTTSSRPAASACCRTKDFKREVRRRLADPLSRAPRDQARPRVRARAGGRRQAAAPAASRSTSSPTAGQPIYSHFYWTTPTATLGNAPVSQLTAAPEHKNTTRLPPGPLDRRLQPQHQPRRALGPPADHRRRRGPSRSTSRRTTRRASASSGIRRPTAARRSSAPTAATTSRSRWTSSSAPSPTSGSRASSTTARRAPPPIPAPRRTSTSTSAILGGFTEPADPEPPEPVPQRDARSATSARCCRDLAVGVKGIYRNYGRGDRRLPLRRTTAPTASAIPAKGS